MRLRARTLIPLTAAALAALATPAGAQAGPGPLFPEPFRVTHHLVQEDGDGSRYVGEPVVDTYGGSWIVSQRPDGSRLVVDLDRREVTGIEKDKGTFWTVSFDRLAELRARLLAAQGLTPPPPETTEGAAKARGPEAAAAPAAALVVTEVTASEGRSADARRAAASVADRPGVRQLRVSRRTKTGAETATETVLDVWVDPSVRLTPAALAAVGSFEAVLDGPSPAPAAESAPTGPPLAAARAHAQGAFPVRTRRPLDKAATGQVEDLATQLDRLERFPQELAEIPEGLRRVPHPLEAVVRFLEDERERDRALAGRATAGLPDGQ